MYGNETWTLNRRQKSYLKDAEVICIQECLWCHAEGGSVVWGSVQTMLDRKHNGRGKARGSLRWFMICRNSGGGEKMFVRANERKVRDSKPRRKLKVRWLNEVDYVGENLRASGLMLRRGKELRKDREEWQSVCSLQGEKSSEIRLIDLRVVGPR